MRFIHVLYINCNYDDSLTASHWKRWAAGLDEARGQGMNMSETCLIQSKTKFMCVVSIIIYIIWFINLCCMSISPLSSCYSPLCIRCDVRRFRGRVYFWYTAIKQTLCTNDGAWIRMAASTCETLTLRARNGQFDVTSCNVKFSSIYPMCPHPTLCLTPILMTIKTSVHMSKPWV